MNTIKIKNMEFFHKFVSAIMKFVPSCKFSIDSEKCIVMSASKESASRAFFTTNVVTCDEEISFCIGEMNKLLKSLNTYKDFNKDKKDEEVSLTFDGAFLQLKGNVSFKIRNISEDVIKNTLTVALKTKFKPLCYFEIDKAMSKKLLSMSFISLDSQHEPKIYMYKEKDLIVAEVNDRTKMGLDSITIPISSVHKGEWSKPIIVNFSKFKTWNLLDASNVKVSYVTDKDTSKIHAILTLCKIEEKGFYVKSKILTSMLKD